MKSKEGDLLCLWVCPILPVVSDVPPSIMYMFWLQTGVETSDGLQFRQCYGGRTKESAGF